MKTDISINENLILYVLLEASNNMINNKKKVICLICTIMLCNLLQIIKEIQCYYYYYKEIHVYDKSLYGRVFTKIFMAQFVNVKSMDANLISIFISLRKMYCKTIRT